MNLYFFKKKFLYSFTFLLFISCSKEDDLPENSVFAPQTELISLIGNNNQLTLSWKPVIIKKFISYSVYRFESNTDEFFSPNMITNLGQLIYQGTNNLKDVYVDNKVPFNSFVGYAVVTNYMDEHNNKTSITSVNYLSYENKDLSFSITSLKKLADGSLNLIWEKDNNVGFENYSIAVFDGYASYSSEDIVRNGMILKTLNDQKDNTLTDASQYTKQKINFAVIKTINGKKILSKNFLSIENPKILNFKPSQTLKNPFHQNEIIIINPDGEIVFYNINSLTNNKIKIAGRIFFCSIGELNGVTDLYVPSENGKVFVIDLNSYEIKKTINLFTDYDITSAITIDNHLLFIEKHPYAYIGGMFVYDFTSNIVLNRNGTYTSNPQSKLVYAKENYFFFLKVDGLEYRSTGVTKLNINGNEVSTETKFDDYTKLDSRLFTLSDDKSFFISTNLGYQSSLDYKNVSTVTTESYSKNPIFGDAKISKNNLIYFSHLNNPRIDVFEKNNFTSTIKQYPTTGIPMFIELFENQIISLNQLGNSYFIETISQ
ncbi:hypothetical protein GCM10011518_36080 [Flavobacterium limi]|uniref:LVIVD repeat-containing protein n=2 Tax=Flavobacterium limi TaxID=2045105 RepID=A0ABQ1UPD1_9FLAO|nr:hypothetical protein GCM10011518_36080 [Flavobacterium limi]